jgi:hypothetical protein
MLFALGIVALAVVVIGVVVAITMAGRQAKEERAPLSMPDDFVAPVSSGGYGFRRADETTEEFKSRVAAENADFERKRSSRPPPP